SIAAVAESTRELESLGHALAEARQTGPRRSPRLGAGDARIGARQVDGGDAPGERPDCAERHAVRTAERCGHAPRPAPPRQGEQHRQCGEKHISYDCEQLETARQHYSICARGPTPAHLSPLARSLAAYLAATLRLVSDALARSRATASARVTCS